MHGDICEIVKVCEGLMRVRGGNCEVVKVCEGL